MNRYLVGKFMYKFVSSLLSESFLNYFIKVGDMHGHYTRASGGLCVHMHEQIIADFLSAVTVRKFGMLYHVKYRMHLRLSSLRTCGGNT